MSALPLPTPLADTMPMPPGAGLRDDDHPLDLIAIASKNISSRRCPKTYAMTGILGRLAVVVDVPCHQWDCSVCGQRKARYYAGIARAGCALARERLRLLTISCPRETPAESWASLSGRWDRLSNRLARRLGHRLSYFGTVERQRRGNPHLHLLLRDSGYLPKAELHHLGYAVGFGFSDIRQILPGAGVTYVTKYLHKSAGQEMPKGVRRIRRSRDWHTAQPRPRCTWGPDWAWQSIEHLDLARVEAQLTAAGYQVVSYAQPPDDRP